MAQISTSYIMIFLSCLNTAMFLYTVANRRRRPMANALAIVSLLTLEWSLSVTFRSLSSDPAIAIIFHELKFIAAALLPVAVFVIVMSHTGMGGLVQRKQIAGLSIIPFFTILLSQTNPWHHIFRKSFEILYQPDGAFYIQTQNNYWFYVHSIYSYALWTASILLLVLYLLRNNRQNRFQTGVFIMAIAFPVMTNIMDLCDWVRAYDLTIIAVTVSMAFFLYAVFFYSSYDLIPLARIRLVDSLPNPIFIYNRKYQLNDANRAALKLAGLHIKEMYGQQRDQILENLSIHPINSDNFAYWLLDLPGREAQVMSLESLSVSAADGKNAGYVDIFTDVTALENAKRKIEKIAITDSLTGLYNRTFFEETMGRFDQEGTSPVGLIIGDVDGLKKVNDTLGHARGDEMIRQAARAMKSAVRSGDLVSRIGGDEFVILLENITAADVKRVIEKINENCLHVSSDETPLSICWGYAIRTDKSQSMAEVFRRADQHMYTCKRARHPEA